MTRTLPGTAPAFAAVVCRAGAVADLPAELGWPEPIRIWIGQQVASADTRAGAVYQLAVPPPGPPTVVIAGCGDGGAADLRQAGKAVGLLLDVPAQALLGLDDPALVAAFVEGVGLGRYRFAPTTNPTHATKPARSTAPAPAVSAPAVVVGPSRQLSDGRLSRAVVAGQIRAEGTCWARDLANEPAAVKNPSWLAAQAVAMLTPLGVEVGVYDQAWLAEHGFGGTLGVGSGSASPPRFVQASWRPRGSARGPHLVLIGKGITFDTGGLNIKPGAAMNLMHTDMSGAAAVLAALAIIARERLPIRVTALVPSAENSVSGSAMRPGDVLRHPNGRTSEVGNTDAEGRLVLADALAYAVATVRPDAIVDIATLTGAMKVTLGLDVGGLFATTDTLAAGLLGAAAETGERLWRLPLHPDYEPMIASHIADATNAAGNPGAITAALYLKPFAGAVPWAHLDIAGPARVPETTQTDRRGATGFGARLLAAWVRSYL